MKIQNLVENEQGKNGCLAEHGLSVYLETGKHKLLVDTGATDAFLRNAEFLGIDLKEVDILILSHGHYDHGGGILTVSRERLRRHGPRGQPLRGRPGLPPHRRRHRVALRTAPDAPGGISGVIVRTCPT